MKKIINGKVYDTATAQEIASYSSPHNYGDFDRYEETLYRSPKGRFFVAGEGGPRSHYARQSHGGYSGGSALRVLTDAEALEWCEMSEIPTETVTKYFDIEEG